MSKKTTKVKVHNKPSASKSQRRRNNTILIVLGLLLVAGIVALLVFGADAVREFAADFLAPQAVGSPPADIEDGELLVAMLDVGQADCNVIITGGTTVMIDSGDQYSYAAISNFLNKNGISRIDYLINTHPHTDHMGAMAEIIKNYDIGEILMIDIPFDLTPTNSTYRNLLDVIDRSGVRVSIARIGDEFSVGEGTLRVLSAGGYDDLNNCSMVLKLEFGRTSFLFTGDAEQVVEKDLIRAGADLACDVLSVGHHGSYRATSREFLKFAAPRYAVVSCGAGNSYGFPHREVVANIERQGAELLRTDLMGDIVFRSDGYSVELAS